MRRAGEMYLVSRNGIVNAIVAYIPTVRYLLIMRIF